MTMTSLGRAGGVGPRPVPRGGGQGAEGEGAEECGNAAHGWWDAVGRGGFRAACQQVVVAARIVGARMWRNW